MHSSQYRCRWNYYESSRRVDNKRSFKLPNNLSANDGMLLVHVETKESNERKDWKMHFDQQKIQYVFQPFYKRCILRPIQMWRYEIFIINASILMCCLLASIVPHISNVHRWWLKRHKSSIFNFGCKTSSMQQTFEIKNVAILCLDNK